MISTNNLFYRLTASPLFIILFATLAFILLVTASIVDTSVPDVIATEAQYNSWVAEHGAPGDQTMYYLCVVSGVVSVGLTIWAYFQRQWVLNNKYWL